MGALDRRRARVPASEPRGDPQVPGHAVHATSRRARSGRCRARYYDPAPATIYAGLQLPGRRRARRRDRHRDRRGRAARRHQGADDLHGDVARVRSRARARSSTRPTTARTATSCALDPATRKTHAAAEGRAHRRPGVQPRRPVALGHPPPERHLHARPDRAAVPRRGSRSTRSRTARSCTTSTSRPTARSWSASFGEISGKQDVRVLSRRRAARGRRRRRWRSSTSAPSVPNNFVFSPDGRYLYGSSYYTGVSNIFRYDLASEEARGGHQRRDRLLPADSARRRRADRLPLHRARASCRRGSRPRRSRTSARSRSSASGWSRSTRCVKTWSVGSPATDPVRRRCRRRPATYRLAGGLRRESLYPIVQGYKDTAPSACALNFSDPLQLNRAEPHRGVLARHVDLPVERARAPRGGVRALRLARRRPAWNRADFYDLFGPTKTGRKGYHVPRRPHRHAASSTSRGGWTSTSSGSVAGNLDRLPEYQNVAGRRRPAATRSTRR